jgi:hypothetical protein
MISRHFWAAAPLFARFVFVFFFLSRRSFFFFLFPGSFGSSNMTQSCVHGWRRENSSGQYQRQQRRAAAGSSGQRRAAAGSGGQRRAAAGSGGQRRAAALLVCKVCFDFFTSNKPVAHFFFFFQTR